jgi:hypothetical protein
MTDHDHGVRQRRSARSRAGLLAAAVVTVLLAVVCGGSPAGASAPGSTAVAGGYLYWSNTIGPVLKPGDGVISRARLNGTDVNQRFIARQDFSNLHGVAVNPGW